MDRQWTTVPISQLYTGLFDGPHATPKPATEGPVFLGIKNVTEDGHLDLSEVRHIAEDDFTTWTRRVEPRPGDLVFTYEATLNRYAIIPEGFRGCLGRRMALIRPNPARVDTRFLHFYFFTPGWRDVVRQHTLLGATVDRLPLTRFPDFPVQIPPLPIQRRIAGILSAYDDLIENCERRIRVLDEMARALYREWFVLFRYPGHENVPLVDSPLGPIPKGWRIESVGRILTRLPSGRVRREAQTRHSGSIPIVDQSTDEVLGFHEDEPDLDASIDHPIAIFGDHTCKMQLLVVPFSIGPNVVPFDTVPGYPLHYVFHLVRGLVQTHEYKRHWSVLASKEVVLAEEALALRFAERVKSVLQFTETLRSSCRVLRRTRDLLLPRLLSGQLSVEEAA